MVTLGLAVLPGQEEGDRESHRVFAVTMSLEAARRLSIPEIFRVLGEKLDQEYSTVQGTPPPSVFPGLSPEVLMSRPLI